jgi:predicted nucleic acid-binding Zn ribbon protein
MLIDPNSQVPGQNFNKPQVQLNMTNTKPVICQNCNGEFFKSSTMFRTASRILLGTPEDQIIPIPVFRCDDCGEVLEETLPQH